MDKSIESDSIPIIFHPTGISNFDIILGGGIACLTGNTKILLIDRRSVPIKDLVNENEFLVYSSRIDGSIVPGRAHSARITGVVDEIMHVYLDNGRIVKCTPEHKFMLRNGTYKQAKDLNINDSLMPLYFIVPSKRWKPYPCYIDNKTGKKEFTHRMVFRELKGEYRNKISKVMKEVMNDPELKEKCSKSLKKKWKDEDYISKLKPYQSINAKRLNKIQWKNQDFRNKMSKISKKIMNNNWKNQDFINKVRKNSSENLKKRNNTVVNKTCPDCGIFLEKYAHLIGHKNHCSNFIFKILKIKKVKLNDPINVWDISVDDYHNFAIDDGIFIHNSSTIYEVYGPESVGKSTLAEFIAISYQKSSKNNQVLWLESEYSLDKMRFKYMGADLNRVDVRNISTVEDGWEFMLDYMAQYKKDEKPLRSLLIIWDTIGSALTRHEVMEGSNGLTEKPRINNYYIKKLNPFLSRIGASLVLVNHVYDKIGGFGGYESPGGRGIKFFSKVRIQIFKKKKINSDFDGINLNEGSIIEIFTKKNKLFYPHLRCQLHLHNEKGILPLESFINYLKDIKIISVKSGGHCSFIFKGNMIKFQRIDQIRKKIEEDLNIKRYLELLVYYKHIKISPLIKVKLIKEINEREKVLEIKETKLNEMEMDLMSII